MPDVPKEKTGTPHVLSYARQPDWGVPPVPILSDDAFSANQLLRKHLYVQSNTPMFTYHVVPSNGRDAFDVDITAGYLAAFYVWKREHARDAMARNESLLRQWYAAVGAECQVTSTLVFDEDQVPPIRPFFHDGMWLMDETPSLEAGLRPFHSLTSARRAPSDASMMRHHPALTLNTSLSASDDCRQELQAQADTADADPSAAWPTCGLRAHAPTWVSENDTHRSERLSQLCWKTACRNKSARLARHYKKSTSICVSTLAKHGWVQDTHILSNGFTFGKNAIQMIRLQYMWRQQQHSERRNTEKMVSQRGQNQGRFKKGHTRTKGRRRNTTKRKKADAKITQFLVNEE